MIRIVNVHLVSASPMSQSRQSIEKKPAKITHDDWEEQTWKNRLHVSACGHVEIPAQAFKSAIVTAAKRDSIQIPGKGKSTYTKHFASGILCCEEVITNVKAEDIEKETLSVPSDGVSGSGKRVWKHFPLIRSWKAVLAVTIVDDMITKEVFEQVVQSAGMFTGIGMWRPEKMGMKGRFAVEKFEWMKTK